MGLFDDVHKLGAIVGFLVLFHACYATISCARPPRPSPAPLLNPSCSTHFPSNASSVLSPLSSPVSCLLSPLLSSLLLSSPRLSDITNTHAAVYRISALTPPPPPHPHPPPRGMRR